MPRFESGRYRPIAAPSMAEEVVAKPRRDAIATWYEVIVNS
jgi:hypothetical protein